MAKKSIVILVIILAVVICIGGVLVAVNNMNNDKTPATGGNAEKKKPVFDTGAGEFQKEIVVQDRKIAIPGWETLSIPADTADVSVDFFNPQANEGRYYMSFELRLADTGEVLYSSDLVKAGQHIQHIPLSHGLPKGTYNAVLHVQPYTADDDLLPTNNADMAMQLIVG